MHDLEAVTSKSHGAKAARLRVAIVSETFAPEVNGVAMTLGRIVSGLLVRGHVVQLMRPRQFEEKDPPSEGALEQVLFRGMPVPSYPNCASGFLPAANS